ncbi:MAG: long-chain fatty acid--CoA ligase [Bacteroidaceae bacterium]|nr:long-chain fatty acid--CoA ligase [Bacteroidaceae bacterium]
MITLCPFSRLIHEQAKKYGEKTALSYRDYSCNKWIPISWNTFSDKVTTVSNALVELGIRVQENIAVFSQNMPEDFYVDFGAYGVRAVTIPFFPNSSPSQIKYMVDDAEIRLIFVGEQQQYDTIIPIFPLSSTLEHLVIFDRNVVRHPTDRFSIYFDDFLKLGLQRSHQEEVNRRTALARPEDIANILYTSGTTGVSKGVVLTHKMYQTAIRENDKVLPLSENDIFLNFLPFTHVFERGWAYLGLSEGCQQAINLRPTDILQSLKEVHPTCMSAVPRFWEKVYEGVLEKANHLSGIKRKLFRKAMTIGRIYQIDYLSKGRKPPMWLSLEYKFLESTIIDVLKKNLGLERSNFFPTYGAAISKEVEAFVHICGIQMITGYGLTESTATVSCGRIGQPFTIGSVGRVLEGVTAKIGENDEILLKGDTIFKEYYRKPKETHEVIDDEGWFHTGDAGYIKNGELFLTDRIKDLYKTSNGKYIAPQQIESKLIVDRFIDQIVVIADRHKYVSALIVPSYTLLQEYAKQQGIAHESLEELCNNPQIHRYLSERINTLQQDLAYYEQVKKFCLLPQPFSMERNEITSTLKMRRKVIFEHYSEEIESMYQES